MNKKLISGLVATLGVVAPFLAFAQSDLIAPSEEYNYDDSYYNESYDYNYDNYDYNYDYDTYGDADFSGAAAGLGVVFFIMMGVAGLVGLAATVFTIWMIVDAAKRDFDQKAMWIILMVLFNWLAALIYFFMVKHKNVTRAHPQGGSGTTPPPAAK